MVIVGFVGLGMTVSFNAFDVEPALFLAVTVTLDDPIVFGVPLMTPALLHVRPEGKPVALQVMDVVPVAVSVAL